jgi:uncharacterized repeat protein (TIGR01451 family)
MPASAIVRGNDQYTPPPPPARVVFGDQSEGPTSRAAAQAAPPAAFQSRDVAAALRQYGGYESNTSETSADDEPQSMEQPAAGSYRVPQLLASQQFEDREATVAEDVTPYDVPQRITPQPAYRQRLAEATDDAREADDVSVGAPSGKSSLSDRFQNSLAAPAISRSSAPTDDAAQRSSEPRSLQAAPDSRNSGLSLQAAADAYAPTAATGTPGPKQLEGQRTPTLLIEKTAPPEIQVGKQATFEITVKNVGQVEADRVVVTDPVPQGTRFVDSTPQASRSDDGSLMWELGTLKPGQLATIAVHLLPLSEGELGSVAKVNFQAQASVSTICTKPMLTVQHSAPPKVLMGDSVTLAIKIANPGTGAATGVLLEEDIPEGLSHAAGHELEYEIGTLKPGESRELSLTLRAVKAGTVENVLVVRGEGNLIAEDRLQLEVIAPQLQVGVQGPSLRYLERQATYSLSLSNPGTAPAKDVELVAYLPKGLKFVEANNEGQYDAQNHAVYWSLDELPATRQGVVQLTALPIETGEQKLRVEGQADLGLSHTAEQVVLVEAIAELSFDVADVADPIEIGSDTLYQVRVNNQGSKTATNVRIAALLPAGLQPISGEGPTRAAVNGQQVIFEPLARLAPKDQVVFKIQARGLQLGDQRIQVQLSSDERPTPVAKEEITRVYADK